MYFVVPYAFCLAGGSVYIQSKVLNAKDCLSIYSGETADPDAMPTSETGAPKPPNTQP